MWEDAIRNECPNKNKPQDTSRNPAYVDRSKLAVSSDIGAKINDDSKNGLNIKKTPQGSNKNPAYAD